eukprot:scaffold275940_cov33-Tisochrysis_lutea.AAC.7
MYSNTRDHLHCLAQDPLRPPGPHAQSSSHRLALDVASSLSTSRKRNTSLLPPNCSPPPPRWKPTGGGGREPPPSLSRSKLLESTSRALRATSSRPSSASPRSCEWIGRCRQLNTTYAGLRALLGAGTNADSVRVSRHHYSG